MYSQQFSRNEDKQKLQYSNKGCLIMKYDVGSLKCISWELYYISCEVFGWSLLSSLALVQCCFAVRIV